MAHKQWHAGLGELRWASGRACGCLLARAFIWLAAIGDGGATLVALAQARHTRRAWTHPACAHVLICACMIQLSRERVKRPRTVGVNSCDRRVNRGLRA